MSSFKKVTGILAVAALLALVGTPANADLTQYWNFDNGTASASIAGGTAGVLHSASGQLGSVTTDASLPTATSGLFGGALAFSGSNSNTGAARSNNHTTFSVNYVSIPSSVVPTSSNTISLWVNWSGAQQYPDIHLENTFYDGIYGSVIGRQDPGVASNYLFGLNGNGGTNTPISSPDSSGYAGVRYVPAVGQWYEPWNGTTDNVQSSVTYGWVAGTTPGAGWHNVVLSYTANGASSSYTIYMDGQSLRTFTTGALNTVSTAPLLLGAEYANNGSSGEAGPLNGSIDDVGFFTGTGGVLSAGKAEAIYNTPKYGIDHSDALASYTLDKMNSLFKVADGTLASYVDGALTWNKVTGLPGADGSAGITGGAYYVNFGGGAGVETNVVTPEPGTLALLAAGLIGLLCYAWRKRK